MSYFTRWNPQKAREMIIDELAGNADIAGKYVEDEARRRLYAITDPEWGQKYRELIVGRLLTHVVEVEAKAVVIWVGVQRGPKGSHHGFYIEIGTKRRAAHPFLRPAVFDNGPRIVGLLAGR